MSDAREPRIPFATAAFVAASMAPDAEGVALMRHLSDKRIPVPHWSEAWLDIEDFVKGASIDRDTFAAAAAARYAIELELLAEADALVRRMAKLDAADKARRLQVNRPPPPVLSKAPGYRRDRPLQPDPDPVDPIWDWCRKAWLALPSVEAELERESRILSQ